MSKYVYQCSNPVCVNYKVEVVNNEAPPVPCGYCGLFLTWVRPYDVQVKFG